MTDPTDPPSRQSGRRAFVAFPANWDDLCEEEKDAACLAMADAMIATLNGQPPGAGR